ncbi:MAG: hypothetical protein GF398_19075 [Chitinivibrionales bacterium]|nr:hypothetical protein [Chitinivibrionales bacterium]
MAIRKKDAGDKAQKGAGKSSAKSAKKKQATSGLSCKTAAKKATTGAGPKCTRAAAEQQFHMPGLPENYGTNSMYLMVRGPFWLFTHWEIQQECQAQALGQLGKSLDVNWLRSIEEKSKIFPAVDYHRYC